MLARQISFAAALLAINLGCPLAAAVGTSQIPVNANVPTSQGPGSAQIGTISVDDNDGNGGGISATFTLAPQYRFLDDWYNFRWINIIIDYTDTANPGDGHEDYDGDGNNDLPQPDFAPPSPPFAELPMLDPAPGPFAGGQAYNDGQPFYFTQAEHDACTAAGFGVICVPNMSSSFFDNRANWPAGAVLTFATYLAVQSDTDPNLDAMTPCLLAGFEWTYTQATGAQMQTLSITDPNATDTGRVADGVAAAGPAEDHADNGTADDGDFAGWSAQVDCTLAACETYTRCARWPRYSKAYTVSSYKYTNFTRSFEWEALAEPVDVPPGPGNPVITYFDVPFNPNDLHIVYSWENSPFPVHHWMFNKNKGESFAWRWYCLKEAVLDVFACQQPLAEATLCTVETDCLGGEPCNAPYKLGIGDEVLGNLTGSGGTDIAANAIPAVSTWGLAVLVLATLIAATCILGRCLATPVMHEDQ